MDAERSSTDDGRADGGSRLRLGILTPSSNTVLEPVLAAMAADLPGTSVHFSRFRVTEIALSEVALGQFSSAPMLAAAELLSHAKVDVISWSGTSASWLGFDRDETLCATIESATGIAASTCVLSYRDLLRRTGAARIGLVSPYTDDVQSRIAANWVASGLHCTAERHLGLRDNFSFAKIDERTIADMIRGVARDGCDAAVVLCTNMAGARIAPDLERELGIPVYDSVAVTLWGSLGTAGLGAVVRGAGGSGAGGLARWGRLFAIPPPNPARTTAP